MNLGIRMGLGALFGGIASAVITHFTGDVYLGWFAALVVGVVIGLV